MTVRAVLCVDDEPHILSSLRRALRGPDLQVHVAGGGVEALELLGRMPVDLVISDMRMPGMDGSQLLEQVQIAHPDIVRVLLTGQADHRDTIAAINRGSVYRYLQKPWDDTELKQVVCQGLERRALEFERRRLEALTQCQNEQLRDNNLLLEQRVAQRTADLGQAHDELKRTYLTSIQVFSSLIELRGGWLNGHSRRVAESARRIGLAMSCSEADLQDLLVASLLHDIGLIGQPDALLRKPVARFSDDERAQFRLHPLAGQQSLLALESMQEVALLVRAHHERHDGKGFPDGCRGGAIPLGARILAVADTYDELQHGVLIDAHVGAAEARTFIQRGRASQFDPEVVDAFMRVTEPDRVVNPLTSTLGTAKLLPGMVLAGDLLSARGQLMLPAGQALTERLIQRIRDFESHNPGPLLLQVRHRPGDTP